VRFNKWTEVLARPEPAKELLGTHAMWRYSRALAFASEGKIGEADKEKALFDAETAAIPPETMLSGFNKAQDVLGLAGHVIEARLAAAKKENGAALQHWREAVAIQDTLNYDEPADWYYPVRESLGAALLAYGKPQEAELVFRADLKRNPRNPRSLFGLKEALRMEQREADAAWVEKQFNTAWKSADTKLTLAAL
jgi:hypothetical protein